MRDREHYRPQYTRDSAGLYQLVARRLVKAGGKRVKLRNVRTAERLQVSLVELKIMHDELADVGLITISQGENQTGYRFTDATEYLNAVG